MAVCLHLQAASSIIFNYFLIALNQGLLQNGGQLLKYVFWVGLAKGGPRGEESLWSSYGAVSGQSSLKE